MNTALNHARLDRLADEIEELRTEVIEIERTSLEMFDGAEDFSAIASAAVIEVKARLQEKCLAYVTENEFIRRADRTRRASVAA